MMIVDTTGAVDGHVYAAANHDLIVVYFWR
jgi:hypothetical protein